jgi:hypothetical protein
MNSTMNSTMEDRTMHPQHGTEQKNMRTYEISTPRLAAGTAAVALTAIAMAIMVIIPATMEAEASEAGVRSAPAATLASGADGTHEERLNVTCAAETRDGGAGRAQR